MIRDGHNVQHPYPPNCGSVEGGGRTHTTLLDNSVEETDTPARLNMEDNDSIESLYTLLLVSRKVTVYSSRPNESFVFRRISRVL